MEKMREILEREGQMQVLRFAEELSREELKKLEEEVTQVDYEVIAEAVKSGVQEETKEKDVIEPIETQTIQKILKKKDDWKKLGDEALKEGKVAGVILAGGQGSRLGYSGSKGTYNVGIETDKYIFQILLENTRENTDPQGTFCHLYIMTSDVTHEGTVAFFKEHNYFDYPADHIHFFKQDMAPALSFDGKMLLETKNHLSLAPNGNGGWFRSLERAGLVDEMQSLGIEWLNVVSVDNILQNIADPVFLGACLENHTGCGAKVIAKSNPDEKVGTCCLRNSHPSVVEYSELTDELRNSKGPDGRYLYEFGVTLNYLFNIQETREKAARNLPIHRAIKKIKCLDDAGHVIVPETPNAIKLEYFIFDILEFFDNCTVFEVVREDEFAPIKNKEGEDSPETARKLYQNKKNITL